MRTCFCSSIRCAVSLIHWDVGGTLAPPPRDTGYTEELNTVLTKAFNLFNTMQYNATYWTCASIPCVLFSCRVYSLVNCAVSLTSRS